LRSTLKNSSRFWNFNHYSKDILKVDNSELSESQDYLSRLENSIGSVFQIVFNEKEFKDKLFERLTNLSSIINNFIVNNLHELNIA
jgi:hypothetical protein